MHALPQYNALVLNADYSPKQIWPLSTWDFEHTMKKVLSGRVAVVAEYDAVLRSQSGFTYRPPSVVALKNYVKVPAKVPFNRSTILMRDGFECQYCGDSLNLSEMTLDHVVPRSKGGPTSYENIVSCCMACNTRKADKQHMRPRKAPKAPDPRALLKQHQGKIKALHQTWIDCLYWSGLLEQDA